MNDLSTNHLTTNRTRRWIERSAPQWRRAVSAGRQEPRDRERRVAALHCRKSPRAAIPV